MKTCSKCGFEKDLDSFYKRKDTKDGLRSDCKDCHNIMSKPGTIKYQHKDTSKEKAKIHNKEYWSENKDSLKIKNKEKYEKNKVKYLLNKSEYYKKQ